MASADLSRRVEKVAGYPPLSEHGDLQRREFHEALLEAGTFEDLVAPRTERYAVPAPRTSRRCGRRRPRAHPTSECLLAPGSAGACRRTLGTGPLIPRPRSPEYRPRGRSRRASGNPLWASPRLPRGHPGPRHTAAWTCSTE